MATGKRLIDANYFVNKGIRNRPIEEGGIPLGDFHKHQQILALYPTVDAVEVVRCKSCKYYIPPEDIDILGLCMNERLVISGNGEAYPKENYFCAYGERRSDG